MNRYPLWKYLLIGLVIVVSAIYALPNGQSFTRFVLQDWYGKEGGCLVVSAEGVSAQHLALD